MPKVVKRRVPQIFARIKGLFAQTLAGGPEDEKAWRAVHSLRRSGGLLAFERAKAWCHSSNAKRRLRGIQVLCQLRDSSYKQRSWVTFRAAESFELVASIAEVEQDLDTLDSAISAMGHLRDERGTSLIVRYAQHPSGDIRFAVACALGSFANEPSAVAALLPLMDDDDKDVRNWATFSLGTQGEADSDALRAAFFERLSDPYLEVRAEAAAALAKRRDLRVIKPLIALLEKAPYLPFAIDLGMKDLLGEDFDAQWTGAECAIALRTAFPFAVAD